MSDLLSTARTPTEAARVILAEMLRTDGWGNCRSGSEKSIAYVRARRQAREWLESQAAALEKEVPNG